MCGIAASSSPSASHASRLARKGRVAVTRQHLRADGGGSAIASGARPEILLAGDVECFPAPAAYQPKVMS
jgi:hypothetical protein